jgi:hypothetical protein
MGQKAGDTTQLAQDSALRAVAVAVVDICILRMVERMPRVEVIPK